MTVLPPELVELIIHEAWHSEMPSWTRTTLMTACPLISRTWKAVYVPIASQHIYITNLAFIHHLCMRKSTIYYPRVTRTITCFIDLARDSTAQRIFAYLFKLPNTLGFKTFFPLVPYISFVLSWTGSGNVCDHPIDVQARFNWYIKGARVDVHITMIDSDPSWGTHAITWIEILETLREVGVMGPSRRMKWFLCDYPYDEPDDYQWTPDGVRHFCQTTAMRQRRGDVKSINWHLWMASKGHSNLGWPTTLLIWLQYERAQWSYLYWLPLNHMNFTC
ncbi:uncharacterized protein ARMOST_11427 [Armillaria ostoyae]|uniref:Uncharacterized protein n=1 Tax=Armillaria ostoyae TaxID=47428 RepID=A0A284RH37_ARMOS|nr:uncharacterized protein ARMOST_11427 [Armillaria ostoyae]